MENLSYYSTLTFGLFQSDEKVSFSCCFIRNTQNSSIARSLPDLHFLFKGSSYKLSWHFHLKGGQIVDGSWSRINCHWKLWDVSYQNNESKCLFELRSDVSSFQLINTQIKPIKPKMDLWPRDMFSCAQMRSSIRKGKKKCYCRKMRKRSIFLRHSWLPKGVIFE